VGATNLEASRGISLIKKQGNKKSIVKW